MTELEAQELIDSMHARAVMDTVTLQNRIQDLKIDYDLDPHETTAAQIMRLENRLVVKADEAKALAIALTKF